MTANVELLDPAKVYPNPDNPRLIFRQHELKELEDSIDKQGILVPLTVFKDGSKYVLLDGERRWRCAKKLGLHSVPAIVQSKPPRVQNIMMMFAIHNARRDWHPLAAARKLLELERELLRVRSTKNLTESELAASASLSRGVVRRYRKIQRIPNDLQLLLLRELELPDSEQALSLDHVIESMDATDALVDEKVLKTDERRTFLDSVIEKFRSKVIKNTVEPRKIGGIARAVRRKELKQQDARSAVMKFARQPTMTVHTLVSETIESIEQTRSLDRAFKSFEQHWLTEVEAQPKLARKHRKRIEELITRLKALL